MRNILMTLALIIFSTSALAGSCPMMAGKVKSKIEQAQKLQNHSKSQISQKSQKPQKHQTHPNPQKPKNPQKPSKPYGNRVQVKLLP